MRAEHDGGEMQNKHATAMHAAGGHFKASTTVPLSHNHQTVFSSYEYKGGTEKRTVFSF